METAADHKVAVKTEDVDTDIEGEEVDSKCRLQFAKVKEEKSDGSTSKCSIYYCCDHVVFLSLL